MRLVALLSARAPVSGAPPSAFTDDLLIGLHTPVEHQARQLIAAGVEQILVRSDLPADDPSLAEALVRLAEARWESGDVEGAREALDRCIRTGLDRTRCIDLRTGLDLEVDGVHAVPVRWTFDGPDHGVFHPRPFWSKGSFEGSSLKALKWSQNQCGKLVLMRLTVSALASL